jgi:predicted alpha/beta-fold hydrolase
LLHGLEGSARSGYALQTYRELAAVGVRAVGLNFRSCGGEPNRSERLYHSGETTDLELVLTALRDRFPDSKLVTVGFSLGANVLLKFLGERAEHGSRFLTGGAAISVPFDLAAGAKALEHGIGRGYVFPLLRSMHKKLRSRQDGLADIIDVGAGLASRTLRQFDEAVTAPLHGFKNADDYYSRSSCGQFLDAIRVPTLVVHSKDDPFLPSSAIPRKVLSANTSITDVITSHGGHVGFVSGRSPKNPVCWAEREVARFLSQL